MSYLLRRARIAVVGAAVVGSLVVAAPAQATHVIPLIPHTKCGFPTIPDGQGSGVISVPAGVANLLGVHGFITRQAFQAAELHLFAIQSNLSFLATINGYFYRQTADGFFLTGIGTVDLGGDSFFGVADVTFIHDGANCDADALYITVWGTSTRGGLPFPIVIKVDFDNPVDV